MTALHLNATSGDIAPLVFLLGDPIRAKRMASMLSGAREVSNIRAMPCFTGMLHNGMEVSVQATGMGIPSLLIYANELIDSYCAKTLIRVGTCGTTNEHVALGDLLVPTSAVSDSGILPAPAPAFVTPSAHELVAKIYSCAKMMTDKTPSRVHKGKVFSTDLFYKWDNKEMLDFDSDVLGIEMESAGLFWLGNIKNVSTAALLTVTDKINVNEHWPPAMRATGVDTMLAIALEVASSV
ncbi:MAG: phosphorylase family protein [Metallibacterium sp.]